MSKKEMCCIRCIICGSILQEGEKVVSIHSGILKDTGDLRTPDYKWGSTHKDCFNNVFMAPIAALDELESILTNPEQLINL